MQHKIRQVDIARSSRAGTEHVPDQVAVEEPLEIQVGSPDAAGAAAKSVSITMRTPGDDADLALGFLFTENIIRGPDDVADVQSLGEVDPDSGVRNRVRVDLRPGVQVDLGRLERHFYTTSSCGVCGKASLEALRAEVAPLRAPAELRFGRQALVGATARLRELQAAFSATGGLHAAAAFGPDGEIVVVREDVGRHNATDKVIGALLTSGRLPGSNLGMLVSGRASFELVQKTLVAGIPLLAAVGAPSSLAVATAREFGMTLVGFLRDGSFNTYAGGQRIG